MATLRMVSGPLAGQTIEVDREIVIGRGDTDLTIEDDEISGRHAVVRSFANRLQVEDLDSTNGTFVDGNRIAEPTLVGGGAEIKIGTTVLVVEGVLPVRDVRDQTRIHNVGDELAQGPELGASGGRTPALTSSSAAAVAPPRPAGPGPSPAAAFGEFHPPQRRQQRGLASRSWVPVALSFGTALLTAIALVIYFSQHT